MSVGWRPALPHYHEAGDTFDKLDYRRMAQVVQGVFAVVQSYSSAEQH